MLPRRHLVDTRSAVSRESFYHIRKSVDFRADDIISLDLDENRDSPERDMVNPSTDSYMWPIRGAP